MTTTTTLPILGQTITFAPSLLQTASPLSTAQQTPVGPTLGKMRFSEGDDCDDDGDSNRDNEGDDSDTDNDNDFYIDSPDLAHSTINLSPLFSLWIIC